MLELTFLIGFGCIVLLLGTRARPIMAALLVAYVARAGAAVISEYVYRLPSGRADARVFSRHAADLADLPLGIFLTVFDPTNTFNSYGWFVALCYRVVGTVELIPVLINVLFGTLVVFFIYKASRIVWGAKVAVRITWVAALFPSFIHYSAVLLREVWIVLPFTIGAYFLVRYLYLGNRPGDAIGAVVFTALSALFHGAMIAGVFGLLIYFAYRSVRIFLWEEQVSVGELAAIALLIVVALPLTTYWAGVGMQLSSVGDLQALAEPEEFYETVERRTESATRGGAAYPEALTIRGPADMTVKLPPRVVYFLFSPFPWDIRTVRHIIGVADAVFYLLLFYAMYTRWPELRRRKVLMLCFMIVPLVLAFSLGTSNFGTGIRHRAKIFSVFLVMAGGLLWMKRRPPRAERTVKRDALSVTSGT